jgi:hypothetical protein
MAASDPVFTESFGWWLPLGYAYSLGAGHLCVSWFVRTAHQSYDREPARPQQRTAATVGHLERALFTSAWLLGNAEFVIGGWFVLKAASVLRRDETDQLVYNTFLVGTGLSLIFGVAGGLLAELGDASETEQLLAVLCAPPLLTLLLGATVMSRGSR